MATEKLYYIDAHRRTFRGRVLSCTQTQKGFEVILDATCFYPEGGGQGADTGTLGGVRVLHTSARGDAVVHLCVSPLEVGKEVDGEIDWEPRFTRMQQHSGEHIVSGILHARFGASNTGFHMGQERTVIDFDKVIPPEALPDIEREANRAVWQNTPVKCWYPSQEELASLPYRSKRALEGKVRIVEIPGYDICACCGTHVSACGEIGLIKLFSAIPFRGGTRIEMACGGLALDFLNRVLAEAGVASHIFSAPVEQIGTAAKSFEAQLTAQKGRVVELQRRLFRLLAAEYAGKGDILCMEPGLDSTGIRELADCIAQTCGGTAAVFSGEDGNGYGFCLMSRDSDLRELGKALTGAAHGRGGGKPHFQQGSVRADKGEILAFFREMGWKL